MKPDIEQLSIREHRRFPISWSSGILQALLQPGTCIGSNYLVSRVWSKEVISSIDH